MNVLRLVNRQTTCCEQAITGLSSYTRAKGNRELNQLDTGYNVRL